MMRGFPELTTQPTQSEAVEHVAMLQTNIQSKIPEQLH